MRIKIDRCFGCSEVGFPCKGPACENYGEREVPACDECEKHDCDIFEYEGEELCLGCIAKRLFKVEI